MPSRMRLEPILAGVVGALLGGLLSLVLLFTLPYWGLLLGLPVLLGGLAGYLFGDRAILGIARILSWL